MFPNLPLETGSASVVINGASIDINTAFRIANPSSGFGVTGQIGAAAGSLAYVELRATAGDLLLGSSDAGGPLVYTYAGTAGTGNANTYLGATGAIEINKPQVPFIEGTQARYIPVMAQAEGDNVAAGLEVEAD